MIDGANETFSRKIPNLFACFLTLCCEDYIRVIRPFFSKLRDCKKLLVNNHK